MKVQEIRKLSASDLAAVTDSEIVLTGSVQCPKGISIDTRTLSRGDLFFAVKGSRFNGHDFIQDAFDKKAWGAVVSEEKACRTDVEGFTLLRTDDTVEALGKCAQYVRRSRKEMIVAGITGSNGKTTTKELLKRALSAKGSAAASPGNFNNFIGVPLSIFSAPADTRFGIIEMGTESPGEIEYLAGLTEPDAALVTNVGDTHLEHLGSREGVAREKGRLYAHLSEDGTGIVNADDGFAEFFMSLIPGKTVTFSMKKPADIYGTVIDSDREGFTLEINGKYHIRCGLPGIHNSMNLLAALGVCKALGFEPEEFSGSFIHDLDIPGMRMERSTVQGITCYNDAYNANPQSVSAGIDFFRRCSARNGTRKILVLGDMLDLGPDSDRLHSEIGSLITAETADVLVTVGGKARLAAEAAGAGEEPPEEIISCSNAAEAGDAVFSLAHRGDMLFLKGSRGMALEQILEGR